MENQPDFIAELRYKTTEEGGRKTPASNGYRPVVKFDFLEQQSSGQQMFIGKQKVFPGETVLAKITLATPQLFENKLEVGMEFNFNEGVAIIGYGTITEILNKGIKKPAPNKPS